MIIKKIFNNNALLAEDNQLNEIILMGKGIAFQKKNGDIVDENLIQKRFVFDTSELKHKFKQLFNEIPVQYLELSSSIIDLAQKELNTEFDSNIYIALSDHIMYAIHRYKEKQRLKNVLLWEIKKFYPKEFKIACKALNLILYETQIKMDEDEAGYIAMHFVNAQQKGENIEQTIRITKMAEDILHIVEYHYQIKLDENSLNYTRFVTHIHYFARRLFSNEISPEGEDSLFEQIKIRYPDAYQCTLKVRNYIDQCYHIWITKEEMVYFMLHINRVCNRQIHD